MRVSRIRDSRPVSVKVNHTCTYARQVLLGGAYFTIPKLRFNNEINPAATCTPIPDIFST